MQWISMLQDSLPLFLICITILGLIIGSFLNVVIIRIPIMLKKEWALQCQLFIQENVNTQKHPNNTASVTSHTPIDAPLDEASFNLWFPASHCPSCKHRLGALENIPVLSYLMLKARCRHCQSVIPWRYPLIEIFTAVLSVIVAAHFHFSALSFYALCLTWALLVLAVIDLEHLLLPDDITLTFLWLGLILNISGQFTTLSSAVMGAASGYLFLWVIYWGFKLLTGKEGMGFGDFKLLAMLGAWLGWQALPSIVLFSSLSGAILGVLFILFKQKTRNTPIPFGPFLAAGGWITLLWGDKINLLYLQLIH